MIRLGISEILKSVSDTDDYNKKIEILHKNRSAVFYHFLKIAFTPGVKWLLPEGKPAIKYNDLPGQQGNLFAEWRRLYLFFPGGNEKLSDAKRQELFVQVLESLDPRDADLLCYIKDGIMPYESVTADLIHDAFPGLLPEETKSVQVKKVEETVVATIDSSIRLDNLVNQKTIYLDAAVIATMSKDDIKMMENSGFYIMQKPEKVAEPLIKEGPSIPNITSKKKVLKTKNG